MRSNCRCRSSLKTVQTALRKKNFFLPSVVQELMDAGKCDVKVMDTPAKWYGVTYHEDKEKIVAFIEQMIGEGVYPETLWNGKGE